jgi:hypothetical protein
MRPSHWPAAGRSPTKASASLLDSRRIPARLAVVASLASYRRRRRAGGARRGRRLRGHVMLHGCCAGAGLRRATSPGFASMKHPDEG